jgi:hypothetical protein
MGLSAMLPTLVLTDGVGAAATPGGIDAPLIAPSPRTARPGHHLGGRQGGGRGQRVPRGLRRRRPVPAHRAVGRRRVPAADGAATGVAESRHCLAVLEAAVGRGEILMAGGGALAPSLAADLADATPRRASARSVADRLFCDWRCDRRCGRRGRSVGRGPSRGGTGRAGSRPQPFRLMGAAGGAA